MPTTASERKTTARILSLEFHTTNEQTFFYETGQLLCVLDKIIARLHWMSWREEDQHVYSFANVEMLELTANSPLKLTLGLGRIPREAFQAFVKLCEMFLFYRQERNLRDAIAAEAWEDVRAKRIRNIRAVAEIAVARNERKLAFPGALDQLLEDTFKVERLELGVSKVEAHDVEDQ